MIKKILDKSSPHCIRKDQYCLINFNLLLINPILCIRAKVVKFLINGIIKDSYTLWNLKKKKMVSIWSFCINWWNMINIKSQMLIFN